MFPREKPQLYPREVLATRVKSADGRRDRHGLVSLLSLSSPALRTANVYCAVTKKYFRCRVFSLLIIVFGVVAGSVFAQSPEIRPNIVFILVAR